MKNIQNYIQKASWISVTSNIIVILFPILYIYLLNSDRTKFSSLFTISGLFIIQGLIFLGISFLYAKQIDKACLITSLSALFFESFTIFQSALNYFSPVFFHWHIIIIQTTIIILFAFWVTQYIKISYIKTINFFVFIELLLLLVFNSFRAFPTMIKKLSSQPQLTQQEVLLSDQINKPNVYYLIFDEYGGLNCLREYCNFDNADFYENLINLGFNVSTTSQGSGIISEIEISNRLNLSNVVDKDMSYKTIEQSLDYPYLFQLFRKNGYQINTLIDQSIPLSNNNSDYYFTDTEYLGEKESATNIILANSIYYPLLAKGKSVRIDKINKMFLYIESSANIQPNRLFTFGYFMFPHLPWVVDENGNKIDTSKNSDWYDSDVYLGQLKYASDKILEMCKYIIQENSESIIILQSDHGYRQPANTEGLYTIEQEVFQYNILNAVYYRGEQLDIQSLSGIDTLITVVNKHFNMNLDHQGN